MVSKNLGLSSGSICGTFALRGYTFKTVRKSLIFVFAFKCLYGHRSIQKACEHQYCTCLRSLSSTGFYNLDRWFLQDEQALDDVSTAANLAKNQM